MFRSITFFILALLSPGLFSCSDHRIPLSSPANCSLAQLTIKTSQGNPDGYPALIPDEHLTLDETNAGSPLPPGLPNGDFYSAGKTTYIVNQKGQLIQRSRTGRDHPQSYLWREQYEYTDRGMTLRLEQYADETHFLAGQPVHSATGYFTLDEKGRLVTGRLYNSQRTYTYDQEGHLIRVVQVEDSGETRQKDLTYENGNVVKVIASGPTYKQTLTYEYDLGRLSIPTVGYDPANELSPDGGQDDQYSRNLVLKKTDARTNQSTGSLTTQVLNTYLYTYTFDAQNRVNRRLLIQTYRSFFLKYPDQISISAYASLVDFVYTCP